MVLHGKFTSHFSISFLGLILFAFVKKVYWIKPADNELHVWLPKSAYVESQPHLTDIDGFTSVWDALNFGKTDLELKMYLHNGVIQGQNKGERWFHAAGVISAQFCAADPCWWAAA